MKKNKILSATLISLLCLSMFAIVLPQVVARPVPAISLKTTTDKINARVGDEVNYTFTVTNTGKVTLFDVSVDNIPVGPANYLSGDRRNNGKLESGETWFFTATYTIKSGDDDPLVNSATAIGYTRSLEKVSNTDTHNVYLYGTVGDLLPDVLTSPNQEPNGGWFGCSVAVGEGLIVVGAAYESIPYQSPTEIVVKGKPIPTPTSYYGAGRVYVYSAANGALLTTLTSPNPTSPGWFGYSVAVGEGKIVVGAPKETSGGVTLAGNAYIYDAITRNYIDTLTSDYPVSNGDGQGYGVSVAVNDGIIAVGSSWETVNGYTGAGRVYLYNVADGTQKTFSPLTSEDPETNGRFGFSVAIDGIAIVVGAPYEDIVKDSATIEGAGIVYIFDSAGAFVRDIVSSNAEFYGDFGFSVAMDAGKIVIGSFSETVSSYSDAGRAYIYDIASAAIQYTLESETPQTHGLFGNSVAIGDGFIFAGAETETSGGITSAGNAYKYSTTGVLQTTLTNLNPENWGTFGWSVAVGEGLTVVGAYDAVYIFEGT